VIPIGFTSFSPKTMVPFTWFDMENDPRVNMGLTQFKVSADETPVVAYSSGNILRNPSNAELADRFGIRKPFAQVVYNLAIVTAGPAGLSGAVYGAS
jgi:thioredoxin reductase (NADPH)